MQTATELPRIPLAALHLSPLNARKTRTNAVDDLAASIAAHGLLQNLTVTVNNNPGEYEVVAGGRRLAAMQQLEREGRLPEILRDLGIPCLVIEDNDVAHEASTAENTLRENMHPADQFDAFKAMVDNGKPIADVAAHFGVSEVVVKQRLKLANVNPQLFQVYREGGMELDQLQALALTDNHEAQRQAWFTKHDWQRSARDIREHITRSEVRADSPLAGFVGVEAYVAAGGSLRSDLFSTRGDAWLQDRTLLDTLVMDKLQAVAEQERAAGWSWVETHVSLDYSARSEYPKVPNDAEYGFASPEDEQRMAMVMKCLEDIESRDADDLPEEEADQLNNEYGELEDEREKIEQRMTQPWSDEVKAGAGVLVFLDHSGLQIQRGRMRPGQRVDVATGAVTGKAKPTKAEKANTPKKPELSQDMSHRLDLHRAAALREVIASQPRLPLELLAHDLVATVLRNGTGHVLDLRATNTHKATAAGGLVVQKDWQDVRRAPARKALDARIDLLPLPKKDSDVFAWLQALSDADLNTVLATCSTLAVRNLHAREMSKLGALVGLDMVDWWTPDVAHFTGQVPKALVLEAVTEACGKDAAAKIAGLKKDALASEAAKLLAGTGWLPKPLRGANYGKAKAAAKAPAKPAAKKPAKKAPAKKAAAKKATGKAKRKEA